MRTTAFVCAALVGLLVCLPASARVIDKDYHETFAVKEGMKLLLKHGDGDVVITPWDKDVIDVQIRYHADVTSVGFGVEVDFNAEFRQTDDTVIVKGNEGGSAGIFLRVSRNEYEYTYTISAPSYVLLELRGDDGDVEVSGWRAGIDCGLDDGDVVMTDVTGGSVRIDVEDGDVRLGGVTGELVVMGDDGDVKVSQSTLDHALISVEDGSVDVVDSSGRFEITVDDGDVDLRRVAVGTVDIRGNDGDFDLDLTVGRDANITVVTDDGDVTMRLGGELSLDYLVTMDDGDVEVNLGEVTNGETRDHRVSGTIGGGKGLLRVRTSDGDVVITRGA